MSIDGIGANDAIYLMEAFVRGKMTIEDFSFEYQKWWRRAREADFFSTLSPYLQRALDVVFTSIEHADEGGLDHMSAEVVCKIEVRVALSIVIGIR
ncbi:colicin immunity domain-containing protein [Lysobacter sp. 5GHs7-4]|uniref:colicin immunity domain-containing protein n=1 Tax=Lysobacter sp. 5GHs7-4 TaxID=2904253 RepID=UPI001E4BBAF5|nr:colicin immunity domain-containing protein [Lysobacter sp. 5GHs7-4]UHQ23251.1 colicin immunity domain-containing protein [Lysobacter sp. 5GHs7-4]